MESSIPDLRGKIADLLTGVIDLDVFLRWYWENYDVIEQLGSDEDVDLLNDVFLLHAEYTSDYIDLSEFAEGLREYFLASQDKSVQQPADNWRPASSH